MNTLKPELNDYEKPNDDNFSKDFLNQKMKYFRNSEN